MSDAGSIEQPASSKIDLGSGQTVETRFGQVYRGVVTGTDVGLTSTQGGSIEADNAGNDFSGRLTVRAQNVTLRDANTLSLAGSVGGNLLTTTSQGLLLGTTTVGGTAVFNTGGSVMQDGDVRVVGTTTINAAGQDVLLDRSRNDFGGRVTVSAQDVTLGDANTLTLEGQVGGNLLANTGQGLRLGATTVRGKAEFNATAGPVTQDGIVDISGTTTINAAGQNVTLDLANDFRSRVQVDAGNVILLDASALELAGTVSGTLTTTSQGLLLGPTTVDGIARISSSGPVTQDGHLLFKSTTTIDAPGQPVTLDRPDNDFVAPLTLTAGETALRDSNLLDARLDTTNTQLTAGKLKLEVKPEGKVRLAGSSLWSSRTTIELGNLEFAGSGTAHLVSNTDGAAMPTKKVEGVSVQDAAGTPLELFIYDAGIFQRAGTTIASDSGVTLSLKAGKASIDLTAGAKVAAKPADLVGLVEAFAIPVDGQGITHPASGTNKLGTNKLLGPLMAVTSDDRAQTGGVKSIVAIASDTIRVAASPTPVVNSDTVMLLGRVIEGGGGSIQTWVAATQRRGGGNIATDPAGVNDNGFSILPSVFLIADDPGEAGGFHYGSEFSPIAVSFGGTGTAGNSTLQTIAPYPFRKTGGAAGPVPIYLSTINNGGVGPTGTVQVLLTRPAAVALSDVRTVVIDGKMVVDTSAYQSIQAANAAILNQLRLEQFESGFSNENVAAQLRKGVITETGVGEAAVDRFLGVAGAEACDGAVASGALSCVSAPDARN